MITRPSLGMVMGGEIHLRQSPCDGFSTKVIILNYVRIKSCYLLQACCSANYFGTWNTDEVKTLPGGVVKGKNFDNCDTRQFI
jgi:hypothetical protein